MDISSCCKYSSLSASLPISNVLLQIIYCIYRIFCLGGILQLLYLRSIGCRPHTVSLCVVENHPVHYLTDFPFQPPRLLARSAIHASRCRLSSMFYGPTTTVWQSVRLYCRLVDLGLFFRCLPPKGTWLGCSFPPFVFALICSS